jgi:hypothetical protein
MNKDKSKQVLTWPSSLIGLSPPMLFDKARNCFYDKLLEQCKDKVCAEIGFGTGLLTMIALKNGAKHIYAFESDPLMFEIGSDILSSLNQTEKVTLINDVYEDKYDTDIVFHEIIGRRLWDENIKGMKSRSQIIPGNLKADICWMDATDNELYDSNRVYEFQRKTGLGWMDPLFSLKLSKLANSSKEFYIHELSEKQIGDLNHRLIPVDSTSYEYNINTDDIPDIIEVEFEVPPMSKVWLEYSIDGFPISREGNWKYDKAIVTKSGGQMTLKQSTSSGIWWLE